MVERVAPVAVDWPDDPATVEEARANPDLFAKKTVGQVGEVIAALNRKPAVMGHSSALGDRQCLFQETSPATRR